MGLEINAANRYVNFGNGSPIDDVTVGTCLWWVWLDSGFAGSVLQAKTVVDGHKLAFNGTGAAGFEWKIDRATSDLTILATPGNFAAYGVDKWMCVGVTWDTGGSSPTAYIGDQALPMAEPSSYTSQAVGSGTPTTDVSNDLIVGAANASGGAAWDGKVAFVAWWSTRLTAGELTHQKNHPQPGPNCLLMAHLWNTGTAADLSGNNLNGTVTGAVQHRHVPLALHEWRGLEFTAEAAATDQLSLLTRGRVGAMNVLSGGMAA